MNKPILSYLSPMKSVQPRRHFHTFDAFRFFAFFLVFLTHLPMGEWGLDHFSHSGGIGVTFFFVLSGFLISYIILHEKMNQGQIDLGNFFMRRILRIWPLYYVMIAFAFLSPYILQWLNLSSSNEGYTPIWWMSCLFLENYNMMFTGELPNVSPLPVMWSLCIEEHFYILWGIAFYFIPTKKVPWLIIGAILLTYCSRVLYLNWGWSFGDILTNLDYFAYGGALAYVLLFRDSFVNQLGEISKTLKFIFAALVIIYVFAAPNFNYPLQQLIDPVLFGILFTGLLAFTLPVKQALEIGDQRWLSRLGIYTYGLYLYHTIVINFLLKIYQQLAWKLDSVLGGISFFVIALLLTIGVSIVSYRCFEKPFLRLKRYF